jgi:hypothetical protein
MPNHEEHCQHSLKRYGTRGDDIHHWIDEPSQVLGGAHRTERHDISSLELAIQMFGEKYGDNIVRNIFLDHLYLDSKTKSKEIPPTPPSPNKPNEFDEPSDPIPQDTSHNFQSSDNAVWAFFLLFAIPIIGILGIAIFSLRETLGLWWSQNYMIVIIIIIIVLAVLIVSILALRKKNKIAKAIWDFFY